MAIYSKVQARKKSKNVILLVKSDSELSTLKLPKKNSEIVSKALSKGGSYTQLNFGEYLGVFKIGKLKNGLDKEAIRKFAATVFGEVSHKLEDLQVEGSSAEAVGLFLEGLGLTSYKFDKYLTDKKKATLTNVFTTNKKVKIDAINTVIDATCWARDLVNEPVSFLTAEQLSKEIVKKFKDTDAKVEVFEKAKIKALKMGGLLAVNKGSIDPPTFTMIEWKPKNAKNKKPIILVGKGIVYDTGGLSLKPTANSMDFMKSDMGGAACMVGAAYAAVKMKTPLHIITLIPSTDNRPGGKAYAPGDVITMFNKMTVEVLNTDAEGRMVLADALSYGDKFNPELVLDAATLTGAAVRSIGTFASCVMGNAKQADLDQVIAAGDSTYDRVVQLPFWDDYKTELLSPIADLKNLGGPFAGMITAGKFLEHFTKSPYIHIDIAGPAYTHSNVSYHGRGGTGAGVRLVTEFLKNRAK
ncbi:MAG: leucyl aminopeptidase [Arenicella sp.]|jgi:leucyl aminopeptidase